MITHDYLVIESKSGQVLKNGEKSKIGENIDCRAENILQLEVATFVINVNVKFYIHL